MIEQWYPDQKGKHPDFGVGTWGLAREIVGVVRSSSAEGVKSRRSTIP